MQKKLIYVILTLFLLASSQGMAQLSVIESFDYEAGASIDTSLGEAGNGWAGPWDLFDGNQNVMTVADTGIVYDDLVDPVPMTGLQLTGANPLAWQWQRYGRYLDQTWPDDGTVYWLSFLIQLNDFTDNGWAGISLYDSTSELILFGHEWGNPLYAIALYNDEGRSEVSCDDGPQWLVVKIVTSADTSDERGFLWVNPDPAGGEPDTSEADGRGNIGALDDGFNRVVVHFGGEGVGMSTSIDEIRLGTSWTDVSSGETAVPQNNASNPDRFALLQNYPNPFNPSTTIEFNLPTAEHVTLKILNLAGQEIETLVDRPCTAGLHQVTWTASNLANGIYFYRMDAGSYSVTKKLVLQK